MYVNLVFEVDESVFDKALAGQKLNALLQEGLAERDYGGEIDVLLIRVTIAPLAVEKYYRPMALRFKRNGSIQPRGKAAIHFRRMVTSDVSFSLLDIQALSTSNFLQFLLQGACELVANDLSRIKDFNAKACSEDMLRIGLTAAG